MSAYTGDDFDDLDLDQLTGDGQITAARLDQLKTENAQLRAELARGRAMTPEQDAELAARIAQAGNAEDVKSLLADAGIDPWGGQ